MKYSSRSFENIVYKTGISITYQYNNQEAYSTFVASVLPILDTMKNSGAISAYKIRMSLDINELDQVAANSVIGTIIIQVNGVIQNITVDLIALPPTADINAY